MVYDLLFIQYSCLLIVALFTHSKCVCLPRKTDKLRIRPPPILSTMPLREFLQKKDQINKGHGNYHSTTGLPSSTVNPVPEIRFVAPDPAPTTSNIPPSRPTYDDGIESDVDHQSASRYNRLNLGPSPDPSPRRKSLSLLHRSSRSRSPSESSTGAPQSESPPQSRPRRLSNLLHRGNSRSPSPVSVHIPADLPQIDDNGKGDAQHKEAQWEKRATVLVQNPPLGSPGLSPNSPYGREQGAPMRARSSSRGVVADRDGDVCGRVKAAFYLLMRLLTAGAG